MSEAYDGFVEKTMQEKYAALLNTSSALFGLKDVQTLGSILSGLKSTS